MEIKLTNVGVIATATIDLNGLSVIVGKNGSGKSTVGKTVYTVIKAVKEKDTINNRRKKEFVDWICKNTYFTLKHSMSNTVVPAKQINKDFVLLEQNFQLGAFENLLLRFIDEKDVSSALDLINLRQSQIEEFSSAVDTETKNKIKLSIETLNSLFEPSDIAVDIHNALVYMYKNIFDEQVNNVKSHMTSHISFGDLLDYSVSNNADILPISDRLKVQHVDENIAQKMFQDATLIETPLLLQMEKIIDSDKLPHYWADLLKKVSLDARDSSLQDTYIKDVYNDVSNALGGRLEYNSKDRKFQFIKNDFDNGANLFVNNAASGEKMLGIFQKLAKNGMFGPDKMVILDEPENHLHPQWLMTLAEILIKLAQADCPIMITTHSPDFLQALRFYAKKHKLSQARFYLADNGFIADKTGKEYEIFDNLATPINNIFESVVEDALKKL